METIEPIIGEVLADLGIDGKRVRVAAAGAENTEAVQIQLLDASGDAKTVIVPLRDKTGRALGEDDTRQRLREHLATFKEPPLH